MLLSNKKLTVTKYVVRYLLLVTICIFISGLFYHYGITTYHRRFFPVLNSTSSECSFSSFLCSYLKTEPQFVFREPKFKPASSLPGLGAKLSIVVTVPTSPTINSSLATSQTNHKVSTSSALTSKIITTASASTTTPTPAAAATTTPAPATKSAIKTTTVVRITTAVKITTPKTTIPTTLLSTTLLSSKPVPTEKSSEQFWNSLTTKNLVPNQNSKFSVCSSCLGGIGNQLFVVATAYGVAASNNMSLIIHNNCRIPKIFNISSDYKVDGKRCSLFKAKGEKQACAYDPNLPKLTPNTSFRLATYLQSWKYFASSMDSLKKQLVIADVYKSEGTIKINNLLKKHNVSDVNDVTLIGVHIRRGDMVNHRFGYMVATADYISKAVDFFNSKGFKNIIYIVCSNDMKWSQQSMPKGVKYEFMVGNSAEVDLAILSSCNHVITTVGTFGWWAGWLSGGMVTYFKWPAKEGSGLRNAFSKDYSDFFLPSWQGF